MSPHQESNPELLLRTELFYPLNYEGILQSTMYYKKSKELEKRIFDAFFLDQTLYFMEIRVPKAHEVYSHQIRQWLLLRQQ